LRSALRRLAFSDGKRALSTKLLRSRNPIAGDDLRLARTLQRLAEES